MNRGKERSGRRGQNYFPINKHHFLVEDKQRISFVCSVETLIIPLLIKVSGRLLYVNKEPRGGERKPRGMWNMLKR